MYRPACRISQTGDRSTSSPRRARTSRSASLRADIRTPAFARARAVDGVRWSENAEPTPRQPASAKTAAAEELVSMSTP